MKKNMRIALFAVLVVLVVMVMAIGASATSPAPTQVATEAELNAAIANVGAGTPAVIELTADFTANADIAISANVNITFQGNHTITFAKDKGFIISNGDITFAGINVTSHVDATFGIIQNKGYGNVTITAGNFVGQIHQQGGSDATDRALVNISGGHFSPAKAGAWMLRINSGNATWNITGGTFDYGVGTSDGQYAVYISDRGAIVNISGGHFKIAGKGILIDKRNGELNITQTSPETRPVFENSGSTRLLFIESFAAGVRTRITGGVFNSTSTGRLFELHYGTTFEAGVTDKTLYLGGDIVINDQGGSGYDSLRICNNNTATTVDISGGTYNSFGSHAFVVAHDGNCVINISGGTFTGNQLSEALVRMNCSGVINITGGEFIGSRNWVRSGTVGIINIGSPATDGTAAEPVFRDPSWVDYATTRCIRLHNGSKGGQLNIYSGKFLLPLESEAKIINAAGATITIEGGTFVSPSNVIDMSDGDCVSKVYIKGGNFTASNTGSIINFCPGISAAEGAAQKGLLEISGGTFNTEKNGDIVDFRSPKVGSYVKITGGTFNTKAARAIYVKGTVGDLIIEGGVFNIESARAIYVDGCETGKVIIRGGTFHLMSNDVVSASKEENSIVYSLGRYPSHVIIEGGLFISDRVGADQVFRMLNAKGKFDVLGGTVLIKADLAPAYVFANYSDLYNASIPANVATATAVKYAGVDYYAYAVVPADVYGPTMGSATARVNVGNQGIRFTSTVSADNVAALKALGTVSYGTIIFPTEHLVALGIVTVDDGVYSAVTTNIDYLAVLTAASKSFVDVAAQNGLVENTDGSVTFRAALVDIKQANYNKDFTAVSYAKVTKSDDTVEYYYAAFDPAASTSSMTKVAKAAIADTNDLAEPVGNRIYAYNSINSTEGKTLYSRYTEEQQNALKAFIPAA
ncbi:MAG: hypothetical protein E7663_05975 [Ruminococcaceae bacterium]|nr:hypothetical protein [Oscillospiraceae bacterium]